MKIKFKAMNENKVIKREDAIQRVADDDAINIQQEVIQNERAWLDTMFKEGWKGYNDYGNYELEDVLAHKFDLECIVLSQHASIEDYQVVRYIEVAELDIDHTEAYLKLVQIQQKLYKE